MTPEVTTVIEKYKEHVSVHERAFDGNFSEQRNYHLSKCTGDFIFVLDPDEIPQESVIPKARKMCEHGLTDLIFIPRINICPGYTEEWVRSHGFQVNEAGWINWPDYQGRVFKNDPTIRWGNNLHEKIEGAVKPTGLEAHPVNALWHVKTVEVQDRSKVLYDSLT